MWKKLLVGALKFGVSFAILGYLFYQTHEDDSFTALREQSKNWGLLTLAFVTAIGAVSITFFRWYLLVRALDIPFSVKDAFRLGFLGYLLNFVTLGVVGGDLLKTVFIARRQPQRTPEVAASVVMDRAIGLFGLFFTTTAGYLIFGFSSANLRDAVEFEAVQRVCQITLGLTIAGAVGFALLLTPRFTSLPVWNSLSNIPKAGPIFERLIGAARTYQKRAWVLGAAGLLSLGVHVCNTFAIFLVAHGLPGGELSLGSHFVVVPISMVANAIPLPGGLGAFEATLNFLYRALSTTAIAAGQGFVIALAFRVITILIAMVGMVYYLAGRREVEALMQDAKHAADDDQSQRENRYEEASPMPPSAAAASAECS